MRKDALLALVSSIGALFGFVATPSRLGGG